MLPIFEQFPFNPEHLEFIKMNPTLEVPTELVIFFTALCEQPKIFRQMPLENLFQVEQTLGQIIKDKMPKPMPPNMPEHNSGLPA